MLLVSADWAVPVEGAPIRGGGVLVGAERIVEIGPAAALAAAQPDARHEHFGGCVLTPGLVNAHTHLTLTALGGVVPPAPFAEWLPRLVSAMKPWEIADHEASGIIGAEQCLRAGVTVVGDIAYGAAEVARAAAAGLGGVFYWELLGILPSEVGQALADLRYPSAPDRYGHRVVCGLSPHSPYTAGPALLGAVAARARELGVPLAIHVAESQAEVDLLRDGCGPLAGVASRTAHGFEPPGTTTVAYLDSLGVLECATAVHLCFATDADVALLSAKARGGVTCPRSNRYLGNPVPSAERLLASGLALGVGTDSSASNDDLDLMQEVRAIHAAEPRVAPEALLEAATLGGARAIGVGSRFGSLAVGKQADLALFAIDAGDDPVAAVVDRAGSATARAVMSGGTWRVRDGALLESDPAAARRASGATDRARAALAG